MGFAIFFQLGSFRIPSNPGLHFSISFRSFKLCQSRLPACAAKEMHIFRLSELVSCQLSDAKA